MINKQKLLLSTLALSVALSMSTAIVAPEPVQAASFKKATNNFGKSMRKSRRKISRALKSRKNQKIIQNIAKVVILGGLLKHSPAAFIAGVVLIGAPEFFAKDISRRYRSDLNWSGCTRCTNRRARVITVPGRKVSNKTKRASAALAKEDIKDIQRALQALSLYKKRIDGDFGPGTRAGVKEFQRSLGAIENGFLSAEQRHRLFIRSEQQGYKRQAVLNVIDKDTQNGVSRNLPIVPAVVTPPQDVIAEYVLAKSQFKNFNEKYLQSGDQGMVTSASLLADGKIELTVKDAAGQTSKSVTGIINDIEVNPHKLSDQWVRVIYQDGSMSEPLILNTRDDFPSDDAATTWMTQAKKEISMLEKLTEVAPKNQEVRIAGTPPTTQAVPSVPVIVAEAPKDSGIDKPKPKAPDLKPGQKAVGGDGIIVVANNDKKGSGIDQSKTRGLDLKPRKKTDESSRNIVTARKENKKTVQKAPPSSPIAKNAKPKINDNKNNTLTGFDVLAGNETCRQNIYISFLFPDGESPISHYNITPPEGTIMVDNGDSTAYFTGACIQGNYDFSYVYIKEAKQQKDWKHFEREGAFQIASNSEQCSIDLNTPEKSASLECY